MGTSSSKVIKTKQRSLTHTSSSSSANDVEQIIIPSDPHYTKLSSIYSDPCNLFSAYSKKFINIEFLQKLNGTVEIKEFIGGSQHLFAWLEDDPYENFIPNKEFIVNVKHNLYGTIENDYGQCSDMASNHKVKLDLKEEDFDFRIQRDKEIIKKAANQVWTLKNVITVCNYTFFHITTVGKYNMELVLASGWNNAGCCSVGDSANNIPKVKPVMFDMAGNNTVFLPEGQEIVFICAGGCNSIIVSKDIHTNKQFVYGAGETSNHFTGGGATKLFTLNNDVSNEVGPKRFIKKALSGYGSSHFLLSDGTLLSYGTHPLSRSGLHKLDPSTIRGETISDFICYEDIFAILTREGNVWVASKEKGTLTVSEFEPGTIVQMIPSLRFNAVALKTRDDDILLISDREFETSQALDEKLLQHLTLDTFISLLGMSGFEEEEKKLRTLARLTQCQDYSVSIHCLHNFVLAFKPNQKKNAAKKRMLGKLKEQLQSTSNPFKDVTFL